MAMRVISPSDYLQPAAPAPGLDFSPLAAMMMQTAEAQRQRYAQKKQLEDEALQQAITLRTLAEREAYTPIPGERPFVGEANDPLTGLEVPGALTGPNLVGDTTVPAPSPQVELPEVKAGGKVVLPAKKVAQEYESDVMERKLHAERAKKMVPIPNHPAFGRMAGQLVHEAVAGPFIEEAIKLKLDPIYGPNGELTGWLDPSKSGSFREAPEGSYGPGGRKESDADTVSTTETREPDLFGGFTTKTSTTTKRRLGGTPPAGVSTGARGAAAAPIGGASAAPAAGGQPAPVDPAVSPTASLWTLEGEDFLKALPPGWANIIRAYGEGRAMPPTSFRGGEKALQFQRAVRQAFPDIDDATIRARFEARKQLTNASNQSRGGQITRLNQMAHHFSQLEKSAKRMEEKGLANSSFRIGNAIKQGLTPSYKEGPLNAYVNAANTVIGEYIATLTSGRPSVQEERVFSAITNTRLAPEARKEAIDELKAMIEGRANAQETWYQSVFHKPSVDDGLFDAKAWAYDPDQGWVMNFRHGQPAQAQAPAPRTLIAAPVDGVATITEEP